MKKVPVIDVFAGAGGLGEGFSPAAEGAKSDFDVRLSIEMDQDAADTLVLRAFFRHANAEARDAYYRFLNGRLTKEELYATHKAVRERAEREVYQVELGGENFDENELQARIGDAIEGADHWVLVGGPPCQAYSSIGRARNSGNKNYSAAQDHRHFLYEEYLRIIASHWPAVFVMENVPGILSSKAGGKTRIFGRILDDLSDPGSVFPRASVSSEDTYSYRILPLYEQQYAVTDLFGTTGSPTDYILESERHGIPQSRHRVILLGIRDDLDADAFSGMSASSEDVTPVSAVLEGMPRLRAGLAREKDDNHEKWLETVRSALDSDWLEELADLDQQDVVDGIAAVIKSLKAPKLGRGGLHVKHRSAYAKLKKSYPELHSWLVDEQMTTVCNSETRGHMASDLHRYLYVSVYGKVRGVSPKLHMFPKGLLPDHANVGKGVTEKHFADRFRVQLRDHPSTTVVSHLGRDGHYFIHYDSSQCRSLTVREAARLQTFPDNFYFCGNRGSQYRQVGNAVPPLLAKQIAEAIGKLLKGKADKYRSARHAKTGKVQA